MSSRPHATAYARSGSLSQHLNLGPLTRNPSRPACRSADPSADIDADCCDGSDEKPGKCKNTCKEQGSARRAELKARAKAYAQGFSKREGYVKEAVQKKAAWQKELSVLESQIKGEDGTVKKLQSKLFCLYAPLKPPGHIALVLKGQTKDIHHALWTQFIPKHCMPFQHSAEARRHCISSS